MDNRFSRAVIGISAAMLAGPAFAVPAQAVVGWTNPTTSTQGVPLTGTAALTEIRVYVATAPIPDVPTTAPILLGGNVSAHTYTQDVTNGQTLYFRVAACNGPSTARVCSALSPQASKLITLDTTPGAPSSVTVTINITP